MNIFYNCVDARMYGKIFKLLNVDFVHCYCDKQACHLLGLKTVASLILDTADIYWDYEVISQVPMFVQPFFRISQLKQLKRNVYSFVISAYISVSHSHFTRKIQNTRTQAVFCISFTVFLDLPRHIFFDLFFMMLPDTEVNLNDEEVEPAKYCRTCGVQFVFWGNPYFSSLHGLFCSKCGADLFYFITGM